MTMGRSATWVGPSVCGAEIAQTLGFENDVVGARIDRRIRLLGGFEGKITRLEGKLGRRPSRPEPG